MRFDLFTTLINDFEVNDGNIYITIATEGSCESITYNGKNWPKVKKLFKEYEHYGYYIKHFTIITEKDPNYEETDSVVTFYITLRSLRE